MEERRDLTINLDLMSVRKPPGRAEVLKSVQSWRGKSSIIRRNIKRIGLIQSKNKYPVMNIETAKHNIDLKKLKTFVLARNKKLRKKFTIGDKSILLSPHQRFLKDKAVEIIKNRNPYLKNRCFANSSFNKRFKFSKVYNSNKDFARSKVFSTKKLSKSQFDDHVKSFSFQKYIESLKQVKKTPNKETSSKVLKSQVKKAHLDFIDAEWRTAYQNSINQIKLDLSEKDESLWTPLRRKQTFSKNSQKIQKVGIQALENLQFKTPMIGRSFTFSKSPFKNNFQ
ncbi:unnamed protein product [Moneuplotes crassus]|uniref:Uncharacterized protein n=1 Tax=Euplotes crassus TaxID=5936 RepID=A0AAD1UN27_EUPCR|nr:unnamed protein product [Moneuplotes crassus]